MASPVIKIGADPELFVRNKETKAFISAHDLIPGTKEKPYPVNYGAVQVDGVAAEFNINPSINSSGFVDSIAHVRAELAAMVGSGNELVTEPVAYFDPAYFKSLPETARVLGCNPDWDAWTGNVNEPPDGSSTTMRTGAGHIHLGWGDKFDVNSPAHVEDCRLVVRQMDYFLGAYSLMWDNNSERRKLYGKAGAFRPKPYGVEYRPLSNVWLKSPVLQAWVWNAAYAGLKSLLSGKDPIESVFGDLAKTVINDNVEWWTDSKHPFHRLSLHCNLKLPPSIKEKADHRF